LDRENHKQRHYRRDSRVNSEVTIPNISVRDDLKGQLNRNIGYDETKDDLSTRRRVSALSLLIIIFFLSRGQLKPTCFVQKCQSFDTGPGVFFFINHHTAIDPRIIPKAATLATQTSIKQGVKSYRIGLNGPHPSSFPQNACLAVCAALKYPVPSDSTGVEWYPVNDPVSNMGFCDPPPPLPKNRAIPSAIGSDSIYYLLGISGSEVIAEIVRFGGRCSRAKGFERLEVWFKIDRMTLDGSFYRSGICLFAQNKQRQQQQQQQQQTKEDFATRRRKEEKQDNVDSLFRS